MDEPPGTEYFTIQGTPGPAFMNNSRMNAGNFVIPGPSYGQNSGGSKSMVSDKTTRDRYDQSKRMDDGSKYKDYRRDDRGRDRGDSYYYDRNSGSGEENYGDSNSSSRDSYYSRSQDSDYGVKDYESSSRREYEKESRHSRSRSSRDRDRDDRGRSRDRESSRRERSRGKERSRDRTRSRSNDRDRDRESSRERVRDRDRDRERYDRGRNVMSSNMGSGMSGGGGVGDWRVEEIPNQTIMVRGLPSHVTEEDLKQEVMRCGLTPRDIRLLRKKDTGVSRGFAFVEFPLLSEAVRWKELTKGALTFPGSQYKAVLHYSIPKDCGQLMDRGINGRQDWNCVKCGVNNFRRRDYCFKCNSMREDVDTGNFGEGSHEVSATPSNTLLFRNLDILTTEERVLAVLGNFTALPIKRLKVAKDKLTRTSRGFCFVELHSTAEATQLHDALLSLNESFVIDGREVAVSYTRRSLTSMNSAASANAASVALAAAQWTNQGLDYSNNNNNTTQPATQYYQYNNYNTGGTISGTDGASVSSNAVISASSTVVSAAPVSASATSYSSTATTQQSANQTNYHRKENKPVFTTSSSSIKNTSNSTKTSSSVATNLGTVVVEGVTYNKYPVPDVSQYQYDKSSGYYYDPTTGLYYDSNSQYYFNSETQQYLYWDGINQTYLVAPVQTAATTDSTATASTTAVPGGETDVGDDGKDDKNKGKDKDKQDKVKIAKKIAKDMERWAKTLNQKKENAKLGIPMAQGTPLLPVGGEVPYVNVAAAATARQSAAADAGFAILEKRSTPMERQALLSEVMKKKEMEDKMGVASYGEGSDSDNELDDIGILDAIRAEENKLVDWHKMACLLCKRQFPSAEALKKHQQLSDLHKQNIATLRRSKLSPEEIEELERRERDTGYRDRAKERREKYGQPDVPKPNRLKDKYLKHLKMQQATAFEEPTKEGIGAENIGNKMLKAMGWSEGQGLGRENQGMAGIIDVTRRVGSAGLGMKGATFGATAKDTYKEAAKKAMHARYMEFDEK